MKIPNKVVLTNEQIIMADLLDQQLKEGSIIVDEAILRLRGDDGLIDLTFFVLVYIFLLLRERFHSLHLILTQ